MASKYPDPVQGQSISPEVGGAVAPAGVWEHPGNGERAITLADPLFGTTQSQAFKRLGFVYKREAQPEEIKTLPQLAADSRKAEEAQLKGLSARLDNLEGVAEKNKSLEEEVAQLRKEKAEREKADRAKAEKSQKAKTAANSKPKAKKASK